jgi:cell division protein FtsA
MLSDINDITEVDAVSIDGQVRGIPRKYLIEVIHPRANEMLETIAAELASIQESGISVGGVVLTGGASLLKGLGSVAEAVLSMPVRIGYPAFSADQSHTGASAGEYNSPVYSTGVGLVMYAAQAANSSGAADHFVGRMLSAMTGWFRSIVGK